ncbi:hypothetical protein [Oceanobacillus luteolus]|uniref:Uncharacterized protein n=1 Tax=Oceanobacillus luteolus TaxID=1274358 RepID=A0ABW4HX49_9BACI
MASLRNNYLDSLFDSLEKQYNFLANGGTNYRLETTRLSLYVVKKAMMFEPFLNHKATKELVRQLLGDVNNERLEDVAKMLYLNANVEYRRANDSPEFKEALKKRRANRKKLELVKH